MRQNVLHHAETVAASLRSDRRLTLLSPFNEKTPKSEKFGHLQAILYMAPHTLGGGKNLCPHSTEACRSGCLFTAGRGNTPRVENARMRRTRRYLDDRGAFLADLVQELDYMQAIADAHERKLAIRLNGTTDILWEREVVNGSSLFDLFPRAQFFDYTRTPHQHRKVPPNWHLTFSLADDPMRNAVDHLLAGRNVAAVAPLHEKLQAPDWFALGDTVVNVVDGELHDLRFLDERPSLVLLKPKGKLLRGGPMVRSALIWNLLKAMKEIA